MKEHNSSTKKTKTKEDIIKKIPWDLTDNILISKEIFEMILDEYAKAYAQEVFEKAMVEIAEKGSYMSDDAVWGWNHCRSEIINRFNELNK